MSIIEFWKANRSYWITHSSKQFEVDNLIRDKFWGFNWSNENLIGKIIYLDQFSRHFSRIGLLTEFDVLQQRHQAVSLVWKNLDTLKAMDEIEIIFALMPFKHLDQYSFIFEFLHREWLCGRKIKDLVDLQRFYIDTYKKAFTLDSIKDGLITHHKLEPYDASLICDYYPEKYLTLNLDCLAGDKLLGLLPSDGEVIVSLSGGVDSMVLLTLLKYAGADVKAVHIMYGNRVESEHEYRLLAEFCRRLGVPLVVYRVQWLRRGDCDRKFYEDMTRQIRFMVYRAISDSEEATVVLGHIKDDVVENIWTNIAHCHHLGNLKKMEAEEVQLGVRILRPFLGVDKADIYRVSELVGIPYFKNTTPSWSNRGKFREHFHKATVKQFGESVDEKMIQFSEAIQAQNVLLNKLLYEPIYGSFSDGVINITTAYKAKLDATCWIGIFEHICHKQLGCSRPGTKAIRDFCQRLYRDSWDSLQVEMGSNIKVVVNRVGGSVFMRFIL
jgi:tRNA(Ile)-lysidine synthetase-like protein